MTYRAPGDRAVSPQHRGRYPGFDVLEQVHRWDDVTAAAVLARISPPEDLGFFTPAERAVAEPLLDLLLAQDGEPRVPVLSLIDNRLAIGETDGWHYDDMPQDAQAWRDTLVALNEHAVDRYGAGFAELGTGAQARLVQAVQESAAAGERWRGYPAVHVWSLWTRYACTAFYSHPWAWNEIGFPGPAYPRGYLHTGIDARDRWEQADRDPEDPGPFAQRVEQARRAHRDLVGRTPSGRSGR